LSLTYMKKIPSKQTKKEKLLQLNSVAAPQMFKLKTKYLCLALSTGQARTLLP